MTRAIIIFLLSFLIQTITVAQDTSKWSVEVATSYRINRSENLKGIGALASRNIFGDFWLKSGILYKTRKENLEVEITTENFTLESDVELRLDYMSIPLMLIYKNNFFNLGLGTNYERYLGSKDLSDNPYLETTRTMKKKGKWLLTGYLGHPIFITNNLQIEPGVYFNYYPEKVFTDLNLSFRYLF